MRVATCAVSAWNVASGKARECWPAKQSTMVIFASSSVQKDHQCPLHKGYLHDKGMPVLDSKKGSLLTHKVATGMEAPAAEKRTFASG